MAMYADAPMFIMFVNTATFIGVFESCMPTNHPCIANIVTVAGTARNLTSTYSFAISIVSFVPPIIVMAIFIIGS